MNLSLTMWRRKSGNDCLSLIRITRHLTKRTYVFLFVLIPSYDRQSFKNQITESPVLYFCFYNSNHSIFHVLGPHKLSASFLSSSFDRFSSLDLYYLTYFQILLVLRCQQMTFINGNQRVTLSFCNSFLLIFKGLLFF